MSTVLVTPNYIACDHMVVEWCIPHRAYTDPSHKKIFIDPNKKFIFALVGKFDPDDMQSEETMSFVRMLLEKSIASQKENGSKSISKIKDNELYKQYVSIFGDSTELMIISKHARLATLIVDKFECIAVQVIGDIHGLGTGGDIAVGLIRGGIPISEIWIPLNHLVDTSSVEHTIIPLNILTEDEPI